MTQSNIQGKETSDFSGRFWQTVKCLASNALSDDADTQNNQLDFFFTFTVITYIILYLDCDKNFAQGSIKVKRDIMFTYIMGKIDLREI